MKAVDYFNKYATKIMKESAQDDSTSAMAMFTEMYGEIEIICKSRNAVRESAIVSAVKEVNQKWNKVRRLITEAYSVCPLKENSIQVQFIKRNPRYEQFFNASTGQTFDPQKAKKSFDNMSSAERLLVTMAMLGSYTNSYMGKGPTSDEK